MSLFDLLISFVIYILDLYSWVLILWVIVSMMVDFSILNMYNQLVRRCYNFLYSVTDPVLRYVRNYISPVSGVDLSVLVLIILVGFTKTALGYMIYNG